MRKLLEDRVLVIPSNSIEVRENGFQIKNNNEKDDQSVKKGTIIKVGDGEKVKKLKDFENTNTVVQYQYGKEIEVDGQMMEFVRYEDLILVE